MEPPGVGWRLGFMGILKKVYIGGSLVDLGPLVFVQSLRYSASSTALSRQ